ncbi:MAG: helix-turn-helix transcriptional regulator [Myxococcales bacterium]|nr:helix-turn-helix transcriptional regulator [Myxococcales bacterium]
MTSSVTLLTERERVEQHWRDALRKHDVSCRVMPPSNLADASDGQTAVVVDVDGARLDSDELLCALGFLRASGVLPIAHVEQSEFEDIIMDLCDGRIASTESDIDRIAALIARRGDSQRHLRLEYVTLSPRGDDVLAILGNGNASLHPRPIDASDDGSEITGITIDPSATRAVLQLESGGICQLTIASVQSSSSASNGHEDIAIDGERLGARLRKLRLEAGLTQAELARRTGIHRPNIARVEAGRHTPSLETLARIANAIGVSTTHVLVSQES